MKCNLIFWVNGTHQIDCKKKEMIHFRKWEKQNIFKYLLLVEKNLDTKCTKKHILLPKVSTQLTNEKFPYLKTFLKFCSIFCLPSNMVFLETDLK